MLEVSRSWSLLKESLSSDVGDYRSTSFTPLLPKMFEKVGAGNLSDFFGK